MRIHMIALLALGAAACDVQPPQDCKLGTLRLHVALRDSYNADSVVVQSKAPPLMQTFAHTPYDQQALDVAVVFPNGYPTDKLLTLTVSALAGGQVLDSSLAQIRTLPGCTEGAVTLYRNPTQTPADAGPPTD